MPKVVKKASPVGMTKAAMKAALKEALAEIIEERPGWLHEAVLEVFEDCVLAEAIRKGRKSKLVSHEEILRVLRPKSKS